VNAILRGFGVCAIAGLTWLGQVSGAQARETQVSSPATGRDGPAFPEYATVEELLRLDAQAALLAARRSVTNPLDERRSPNAAPQGNALLAIFGTDRILNAEVQIGARVYTYRSAARRAVSGGVSPYLLDKIDPPCVHLSQGQQKEVLCLSRAQP
jgi:hypothetical protein